MRLVIAIDDASMMTPLAHEIALVKCDFLRECGDIFEFVEADPVHLADAPRADVYVVDFGGLGVGFSTGAAERCAVDLMRQIDKNPGRLYCVWSVHTGAWYRDAIYEALGEDHETLPANAALYDNSNNDKFWNQVRAWLGLTAKPELTPEVCDKIEALLDAASALNFGTGPSEPDEEPLPAPVAEVEPEDELEDEPEEPEIQLGPWPEGDDRKMPPPARKNRKPAEDGGPVDGDVIGELRIPIRLSHRPGLRETSARFKFADTTAEVEANGHDIGRLSGCVGGVYEISIRLPDNGHGDNFLLYYLHPREIWNQMLDFHDGFLSTLPQPVESA